MNQEKIDFTTLSEVLPYWFGEISQEKLFDMQSKQMQRWYGKMPEIDADIEQRFGHLYQSLRQEAQGNVFQSFPVHAELAAVIALDQFPRNMYRDTAKMYESDSLALQQSHHLIAHSEFLNLDLFQQMFATLPLMHAERLFEQNIMMGHFQRFVELSRENNWPNLGFFENALGFARRHLEIVSRFGRFPHRNNILGRESTREELAFLKEPDSSF